MRRTDPLSVLRARRTWAGLGLAVAGSAALIGLQIILSGDSAACQRLQIELGLAGATLGSALAQAMLLVGAWLIWSARDRPAGS